MQFSTYDSDVIFRIYYVASARKMQPVFVGLLNSYDRPWKEKHLAWHDKEVSSLWRITVTFTPRL